MTPIDKAALKTVTIAAAAVLAAVALAACGSGGSSAPSPTTPVSSWVTSTPAGTGAVDSVKWDLPYGEPSTLDWLRSASFSENTVLGNLCESLIRLGPDFNYEPGLAKSWRSPNPTTWVYELQPGLKFSDGKPVTTADVIYSLERNRNPKLGSYWEPWFARVQSITATGPEQITVKLKQPDALFNEFLATAGGVVGEKSYIEQKGSKYGTSEGGVMCVGPYELTNWTPGKGIVITANPDYWRKSEAPKVKSIDYSFVTDGQTLANALTSGEISGTYEAPLVSWPSLLASGTGHGFTGKSTAYDSIDFTEKHGPTQNVDFRRALSLVIDRKAVAASIFHGAAEPIRSEFFPATWGYAREVYKKGYEELPSLEQNLAEAKRLVAKVPGMRPVTMLTNSDDEAAKQLAAYVQSEARKAGIEIVLKELPAAQYIAAAFEKSRLKQYDLSLNTTGYLDLAEPVEWAYITLISSGIFNSSGYDNPSVNKWSAEAREALDPTKRAELMVKVEAQAYGTDVDSIPIVSPAERLYMSSKITGATPSLTPLLYAPWARALGAAG